MKEKCADYLPLSLHRVAYAGKYKGYSFSYKESERGRKSVLTFFLINRVEDERKCKSYFLPSSTGLKTKGSA